jgi:OFA family oxalate/formate antiporter-like MFS transporter
VGRQPVVVEGLTPSVAATARTTIADTRVSTALLAGRWWQLALGIGSMVMIASPQYIWALFTRPVTQALGATLAQVQVTFSILIVVQTFLSPAQGLLVDRFGPRLLLSIGAGLAGLSWVLAAQTTSLTAFYLTYGLLGGIGTGIVYVGVVGHMVQWFPDRRGLATGFVAAGYGMGALLFTFPVSNAIEGAGYRDAMWSFGLVFALAGVVVAQGLRRPAAGSVVGPTASLTHVADVRPTQMLRTPVFWLLFLMMTMMSTSGLMVTSQMGAFTADFGMAGVLVWGLPLLPLALSIDRITNGATRPFFGWVSDRIGRENTMFIAFALEAVAMTLWLLLRDHPVMFVLLSGLVFFGWGEIFSLFPSTLTDTFGTAHATTNYGLLYMAQGIGSVLGGPVAALLHDWTQSWIPVFATIIVMDATTAVLALFVLKPLRRQWLEGESRPKAQGPVATSQVRRPKSEPQAERNRGRHQPTPGLL